LNESMGCAVIRTRRANPNGGLAMHEYIYILVEPYTRPVDALEPQ
jgi:hypothetical protein